MHKNGIVYHMYHKKTANDLGKYLRITLDTRDEAAPFITAASLGDDYSAGALGKVATSDFSAFDETATLARFKLTGLTFLPWEPYIAPL